MTITVGPFALAAELLLVLAAIAVALWVAARLDTRTGRPTQSLIWSLTWLALAAGRIGFVVRHFDSYKGSAFSMIDLRDGGFSLISAFLVVAVVLVWFIASRYRHQRKALILSVAAGASTLGIGYAVIQLFGTSYASFPEVAMATLEGDTMTIQDFHGKPVVVNLWASWCPPCRREMPVLQQGQRDNPGVHFVFANQGESAAIVKSYLADERLELRNIGLDTAAKIGQELQSRALPTTVFLDANGRILDMRFGELSAATLNERLSKLR